MAKTGESGESRRARMEAKVGKAVDKEERLAEVTNRASLRDSPATNLRAKQSAAATRDANRTVRVALGRNYYGEQDVARMRDEYRRRQNSDGNN